jgi:hypothetical protein
MSPPVIYVRQEGTFCNAVLEACRSWVRTRILVRRDLSKWQGPDPPPEVAVVDLTPMWRDCQPRPTLFRTPLGEYFRFVTDEEHHALCWSGLPEWYVQRYPGRFVHCGLTKSEAHEWLRFNGYDTPSEDRSSLSYTDVDSRPDEEISTMSGLPSRPCRGCGTPFWIYALYCPQCGMERWGRTFKNEMLEGPGWFNHDTGEEFEGRELPSQASIDGLPAQPARPQAEGRTGTSVANRKRTEDQKGGERAPTSAEQTDTPSRLVVTRKPPRATLDNQEFNLTDEQAAFLSILYENLNQWVEPGVFREDPNLAGCRLDRVKNGLDKDLQAIVKAKPGTGYKMILA